MDSDHFFGFDASSGVREPVDAEGSCEGGPEEDYDALNDETFGSAMVEGDWEDGHEQMATLTEAGRQKHKEHLRTEDDVGLADDFRNLGLGRYGKQGGGHLGESSAPINIRAYHTSPSAHHHMNSALLAGSDLPGSPSNSIWTPSPVLDKLMPVNSPSNGIGNTFNQMQSFGQPGLSQPMGMPSIKTVAELEEEMKMQHALSQPPQNLHLSVLRAEDLEREMARQTANKRHQQQQPLSMNNHMNHQQFNMGGQNAFSGGMPNNHGQMNRQLQRPYGSPGNFQNHMQHMPHHQHQQQQQHRFMNNTKGMFNQHHNHHHNQGHEGMSNYHQHHQNQHHQNNYNNHYHQQQQQQQQQQNYHFNNRNPDGRYYNHNGIDQGRSGNGYDRRNMDRRHYDQNRGHDQNKSHYDRQNNTHDNYSNPGGGRMRRDSEAEWEEWHRIRDQDEYCGLMTPREKSWLKNIQAMQLHSETPYQDDYYYVMYSVKQQRKREEEVIEIDGLQLLNPDQGKDGGREYEPPRLENSLGKLQVVSVNAPRKIIDLQVVHLDPSHPTTPLQREMRRHRHLLLHIEKLFNMMMELDDLERKIRFLADCPTRDNFKSKSNKLASRLWESINATPERLVHLLCIRKGKSLITRLLSWLGKPQREKVMLVIMQNLTQVVKRDVHDQLLPQFWPMTDHLVALATTQQLLDIAAALNTTGQGSQKANLLTALYNKYGISLVLALMVRGETLQSSLEDCQEWKEFLLAIINGLTNESEATGKAASEMPQALPSVAMAASPHRPSQHLSRCGLAPAALLTQAQEKMTCLTVSHAKLTSLSPAKS